MTLESANRSGTEALPSVVLRKGREKPVRQQHPWIFSGAIDKIPDAAQDGDIVEVVDTNGRWLARGYLNRQSQIQVRILTWSMRESIDDAFWERHLRMAITARASVEDETTALRLVNAESDYLPGLTVDRYANYLVMQVGTLGIDLRKQRIAELLLAITGARGVIERSEMTVRKQEGLREATGLLAGRAPEGPVEVHEHGRRFLVDLIHGQKTGFYTDQRTNRLRVARYCKGKRVLNGFSYTGAFAVHALAAGAHSVLNLDSSLDALEIAEENLRLNGYVGEAQSELLAGDVFTVLREWRADSTVERFDVVILDPPKFVNSQAQLDRGLRGYKEVNMCALALLKPGGILATFSCSGLVSAELFQKVIFGAAVDVGREVQILEWLRQDRDHPVAITFPEGEYLKGLICRVL